MTVKSLKEHLSEFPDDALVILSKDSEGNGFSPLVDISEEEYLPTTTSHGELAWTEDDLDVIIPNAVVLWPVS